MYNIPGTYILYMSLYWEMYILSNLYTSREIYIHESHLRIHVYIMNNCNMDKLGEFRWRAKLKRQQKLVK